MPPDAAPGLEAAFAAAEGRDMLVDFHHTLFASNSTELFLASARPAFLASIVLGLVRGARHHAGRVLRLQPPARNPPPFSLPVPPGVQVVRPARGAAAPALGVALLAAQVLVMSMNYTVYRVTGVRAGVPREEFRLVVFLVLGTALALNRPAVVAEAGPVMLACTAAWLAWRIVRLRVRTWRRARR